MSDSTIAAFRNQPKQDKDESERGEYATVSSQPLQQKNAKTGRVIGLAYVVGLLVLSVGFLLAHHFFYAYLNEKSIDPDAHELSGFLQNQSNVNFVATAIAHAARIALSMAIGVTFAQLFWEVLRSRSHSIAQIDALVKCGQSPSAFRAATSSFPLFVISLIASATALVVVLSPGALTVDSNFERTTSCTVPSVPQEVMTSDYKFDANSGVFPLDSFMLDILTSNSYLPPFQPSSSACDSSSGTGTSGSCAYNLTFFGPAMGCVDTTNVTTFTGSSGGGNLSLLYQGTLANRGLGINITTNDLVTGVVQSFNCTPYNATYSVGLDGSSIQTWGVTLADSPLALDNPPSFSATYVERALAALSGTVYGGPGGFYTNGGQSAATPQLSGFFVTTTDGNQTFSTSAQDFVTSFVQNVSLSLLSGNVFYNRSTNSAEANLEDVESTCASTVAVYIYNRTRLLATYGAALGIAVLIAFYGCLLILRNGREEKLVFSDVIRIGLNEELFGLAASGNLVRERTRVRLVRTDDDAKGRLLPKLPVNEVLETPLNASKERQTFESPAQTRRKPSTSPAVVNVRMILPVLITLLCMVAHHFYYRYLNGKAPTSTLRRSEFSRNQTIVSDIGLALSYVGQVCISAAMSVACVQLLWRSLRSQASPRGHAIAQIDALMHACTSPFSPSIFRALRASASVSLVAALAASTSFISIFAPGAIRVSPDHSGTSTCNVQSPRNLSTLVTPSSVVDDYISPISAVLSLGSYLPSAVNSACDGLGSNSQCSYDLQFAAPGFSCEDVTASSNYTAFADARSIQAGTVNLFQAQVNSQTDGDLTMEVNVQSWDVKRSVYQSVNCTGVSRSYSVSLASSASSSSGSISVVNSDVLSTIQGNISSPSTFEGYYLYNIMNTLSELSFILEFGTEPVGFMQKLNSPVENIAALAFNNNGGGAGGIGFYQLDGNITWQDNMTLALEEFAANVSLSLLSSTIFNYNPDDPNVLETVQTTCAYTFTAYEYYAPYRLFVTYGVASAVAALCVVLGSVAVRQNGVAETMDFSRILRAVLNEKMYFAATNGGLDKHTELKADDQKGGTLVPVIS
ncbi:hypothetical protein SCHPADRAFT_943515 [Schizopora paradoxa]|uniref:Uncharacterized protein n=1 Tax=Schizopora paradoxa TaxID=27342 RepID=A0A0H2RJG0_9AGAM|nr:hypothetical protein SCHPADRAFT_943515 [Schizopora paradoxa]